MSEDDRLTDAPVLVEDLSPIGGGEFGHSHTLSRLPFLAVYPLATTVISCSPAGLSAEHSMVSPSTSIVESEDANAFRDSADGRDLSIVNL
jgi:hypothetical protein